MRRFEGDQLVLASHNAGKLREIGQLLTPFGLTVRSAKEFGLDEPEETETNFEGNARLKAQFAARATGLPSLSDDSGLEVDALDGAPGVYTADWAETGAGRDFEMAMHKVWDKLEAANAPEPRTARFVCTLCLAWPDGTDEVFRGECPGRLVWPMRGTRGFGYDPMFLADNEVETFGEIDPARKARINHRAAAFRALVKGCFGG